MMNKKIDISYRIEGSDEQHEACGIRREAN
jgi:hypothetical protein